MEVAKTSHERIRASIRGRVAGSFMSTTTERLLRLMVRKMGPRSRGAPSGTWPAQRMMSPPSPRPEPGSSILITSAPWSPRIWVA